MTELERYEEFFCKALLVLGPYDFGIGEVYRGKNATPDQSEYMRAFAHLARECGFNPDVSLVTQEKSVRALFTDYFYYWRGEHSLFPHRIVDSEPAEEDSHASAG